MDTLFSESLLHGESKQDSLLPKCAACKRCVHHTPNKIEFDGKGRKGIMVIIPSPTKERIECGKDRLLAHHFRRFGIDLDRDCWIAYSYGCYGPGDRKSRDLARKSCRPLLIQAIKKLKPKVIIPIGWEATHSLLSWTWRNSTGRPEALVGQKIPDRKLNAWICPTYDFIDLRKSDWKNQLKNKAGNRFIVEALKLKNRPWKGKAPSLEDEIETEMHPRKGARLLRDAYRAALDVDAFATFDYEGNALKPEYKGARLYSVAFCFGFEGHRISIACPWSPEIAKVTKEILTGPLRKIAAGLKFEDRWSQYFLKAPVNNWFYCTQTASHILDSRDGVTGLKFQAYTLLGIPDYNAHVEPYFQQTSTGRLNRIDQIDMGELLIYNAKDSLIEDMVARIQMKELFGEVPYGKTKPDRRNDRKGQRSKRPKR